MLDPIVVVISKIVKPKAVPLHINYITELCFQQAILSGVQRALKNGVLYPLAVVHTLFGQLMQAALSGSILGVYVVSDNNKHDLCYPYKTTEDFEEIEQFVAENDPYHHLLSNHNCFALWDFSRPAITHTCYQIKMMHHIPDWYRQFQKPVVVDECCYEGNLPQQWGCISGEEMVSRFWTTVVSGGYCTHGETFLDPENEVVWWAKGGRLTGKSPERIGFLKDFVYSLPGYIEPADAQDPIQQMLKASPQELEAMDAKLPEGLRTFAQAIARMSTVEHETLVGGEYVGRGKVGDQVYLLYLGNFCPVMYPIDLPKEHTYRVEVIDTWEMTRTTVLTGVSGNQVMVPLPGKIHMAIAAFVEES